MVKCDECQEEKATSKCIDCGRPFCEECAIDLNSFCNCLEQTNIEPIERRKTRRRRIMR